MHRAVLLRRALHAKRQVDGLQRIACYGVDLRLQERVEGGVHGEFRCIAVAQVHACSEQGDSQFAALLCRLHAQLVGYGLILR